MESTMLTILGPTALRENPPGYLLVSGMGFQSVVCETGISPSTPLIRAEQEQAEERVASIADARPL